MAKGSLQGRHALVTGGGRGIGAAIAAALTAAGARVTVTGRNEGPLAALVEAGGAAGYALADAADEAATRTAIRAAVTERGPVSILVANAGAAESAPFARTDADMFRRMLDINLMGVVHAAGALLTPMTEAGFGRIVVVASTAGLRGYAYTTAYCAAKHAAIGLVRSLALETARTGVTVNAVCPGFTATDLVEESIARIMAKTGRNREAALAELTRGNPQGRLVAPAEVADAVLWLCGEDASAITGQSIAVAGGEVM
ncbi:NADP-dependent 3-hydroxy acid dehydrogenase YdfG [Tepidamorphus gemmatus]|uniref:NADP-dependent 3-hydroxy acid dehydrogenase YdfG n=1 Tax=Tepidamorphus gemmatus TaxID=747076 RepID=A0A4R3MB87_9HYPH|nr:SDR family NAD(P)-dependent oxidoreductase [Tepidamorphus gemmatus]TCT10576.1 NADP-dependent 3-hydroxy acid dehydrogenase YdfG [Tepidamorphus gemmatus]